MTTTTDDGAALLRAVLLRPDDDLARLVYADWLDEHDQPERAEFIRVQVELATVGDCRCIPPCSSRTDYACPAHTLRKRGRELFHDATPWAFDPENWENRCDSIEGRDDPAALWSRGFVSEVRLTLGAFLGEPCENCDGFGEFTRENSDGPPGPCPDCGGKWNSGPHFDGDSYWDRGTGRTEGIAEGIARWLFQTQPVTRVVLVDREPLAFDGRWMWHNADHLLTSSDYEGDHRPADHLPGGLFEKLEGHIQRPRRVTEMVKSWPTRQAALDALSRACVALGRGLAGLGAVEGERLRTKLTKERWQWKDA